MYRHMFRYVRTTILMRVLYTTLLCISIFDSTSMVMTLLDESQMSNALQYVEILSSHLAEFPLSQSIVGHR